jgi:hypothetical protein
MQCTAAQFLKYKSINNLVALDVAQLQRGDQITLDSKMNYRGVIIKSIDAMTN